MDDLVHRFVHIGSGDRAACRLLVSAAVKPCTEGGDVVIAVGAGGNAEDAFGCGLTDGDCNLHANERARHVHQNLQMLVGKSESRLERVGEGDDSDPSVREEVEIGDTCRLCAELLLRFCLEEAVVDLGEINAA